MIGNFWHYMRDALRLSQRRSRSTRRRRDGRTAILNAELLEQRELLSVSQILFDATESRIYVQGTGGADQVSAVMESADQIRVLR